MNGHEFIFMPGEWLGFGKLTLAVSPEQLRFYTKWSVTKPHEGLILCEQQIETEGVPEVLVNTLRITLLTPQTFDIELKNDSIGQIIGKGKMDPENIMWRFDTESFKGLEIYTLQENKQYIMHAEYIYEGQLQTKVDGRIWKK